MFPACAGMNQEYNIKKLLERHVPRMRGDEPNCVSKLDIVFIMFPACAGMNRDT